MQYHGNYQAARNAANVIRYCKKGGKFLANVNVETADDRKKKKNEAIYKDPYTAVDDGLIQWN